MVCVERIDRLLFVNRNPWETQRGAKFLYKALRLVQRVENYSNKRSFAHIVSVVFCVRVLSKSRIVYDSSLLNHDLVLVLHPKG
jgi:hypothetical protein